MPKFITTQEAADQLINASTKKPITRKRVLEYIHNGRLPAKKHGRDWLINESDLKLLKDRKPGRPYPKKS